GLARRCMRHGARLRLGSWSRSTVWIGERASTACGAAVHRRRGLDRRGRGTNETNQQWTSGQRPQAAGGRGPVAGQISRVKAEARLSWGPAGAFSLQPRTTLVSRRIENSVGACKGLFGAFKWALRPFAHLYGTLYPHLCGTI